MKNIFRKILIVFLVCLFVHAASAQYNYFSTTPYSGASGLNMQPASIVDSRYSMDITAMGLHMGIATNYAGNLFSFEANQFTYSLKEQNNLSAYLQIDLLNAMISITPRQSVGFGARTRGIGNIGNAPRELMEVLYSQGNYQHVSSFALNDFYAQYLTFSQFFVSYAMMLTPKDAIHSLSAGASLKLNAGGSSSYMNYSTGTATYDRNTNTISLGTDVSGELGRSQNTPRYLDFSMNNSLGVGVDLGFVYEYRPNIGNSKYDMDGVKGFIKPYPDKYLFKASVSLLDLGTAIKYKAGGYYTFTGNGTGIDISGLTLGNVNERVQQGVSPESASEEYSMKLPLLLNIAADLNVGKGVYLNAHAVVGFSQGAGNAFYRNTYTLTPRYERLWFGVGIPVQYDQYSNTNLGIMLRLGPLWIGSQTLFTNLASKNTKATDVSVMVKIPFTRSMKKDSDGDGVSDEFDLCPNTRGPWATQGCPDTDGDGIPDDVDLCPYEPGALSNQGCPEDQKIQEVTLVESVVEAVETDYQAEETLEMEEASRVAEEAFKAEEARETAEVVEIMERSRKFEEERVVRIEPVSGRERVDLTVAQKQIVDNAFQDIEFDTGKATFRESSYASLDGLIRLLRENPQWRVIISGHTDNVGSPSLNKQLSLNRAATGRNYLVKNNIAPERVEVRGMGDTQPLVSNNTKEGRQKNRRMEVTIVK